MLHDKKGSKMESSLETAQLEERVVYLDYQSTTPCDARVVEAMLPYFTEKFGNPHSRNHKFGWQAEDAVEKARQKVAHIIGANPKEIIFTSGATEANNTIIKGFAGRLITSAIEHESVLEANKSALRCRVEAQGVIDLTHLENLLESSEGPTLVSIMAANNETGVIQPLSDIVALSRQYGAKVHCDAVQILGKAAVDWASLNLDFISISGHKIGALQGIGALIVNERIPVPPLMRGGGQERYYRSGTENSMGIVSFGAVIKACKDLDWSNIKWLRDYLETQLIKLCPELVIFGNKADRLSNTCCFATPGIASNTQVMYFDLMGISVSAGSACSSGKVKVSHVLQAMDVAEPTLQQSLRVSLGQTTTEQEIHRFMEVWQQLYERTQSNLKERIVS